MSRTTVPVRLLGAFAVAAFVLPIFAQSSFPIEGYINGVDRTKGYEVGGRRFLISSGTSFATIGSTTSATESSLRAALRVGSYVEVTGSDPGLARPIVATTVLVREHSNEKLSGIGVITRVVAPAPEAVFEVDGYIVRILPSTQLAFVDELKSLADVSENTWLHFSGKRGQDGVIEAAKAQFIPAKPTKFKAAKNLEIATVKTRTANDKSNATTSEAMGTVTTPDDGAALQTDKELKIGLSRWHTLPADQLLQQRVHRIGMALVPAYQTAMADDNPSKIHFRFFAVDNNRWRGAVCLLDGAVLVSTQTIERLNNDDQLAAVLADGIACNLQRQMARIVSANRKEMTAVIAFDVAEAFVPGVGLGAMLVPGMNGMAGQDTPTMQQERLRMALALMQDAGFDPNEAPEALRLIAPRKLPKDLASLNYPDTSCYQIEILRLQYGLR